MVAVTAAAAPLTLDRVIGQTCLSNAALAVNSVTGDVHLTTNVIDFAVQAYPAGCVVVIYQPRRNRQFRYFRAGKTVSCIAFSRDGSLLAVGERGDTPSIIIWNLTSGAVIAELKYGHSHGVACVAFSPKDDIIVSAGFKLDARIQVWKVDVSAATSQAGSTEASSATVHRLNGMHAADGTTLSTSKIFMDVTCGKGAITGNKTYCITSDAKLCVFSRFSSKHVLESCQELSQQPNSTASTTGYCISYLNDQLIAVGCSNGCIQLLDAVKLTQIAILPTIPPLGHANITNIQELQELELKANRYDNNTTHVNNSGSSSSRLVYPDVYGIRISPSGTKVVAVYSDRSLMIEESAVNGASNAYSVCAYTNDYHDQCKYSGCYNIHRYSSDHVKLPVCTPDMCIPSTTATNGTNNTSSTRLSSTTTAIKK
eukprot:13140-Heterococcus_DN1.PRE.1